jgi:hypothetical protein
MNQQQREERPVVSAVVRDDIVENKAEKKERNTNQRQKEGTCKRIESGNSVNISILVEDAVQERPADRDNNDTQAEVGVSQDRQINRATLELLSVQEKQRPAGHCHDEIGNTVIQRVAFSY